MLQGMTWASPPALRMPAATSSQASALRLEITTLAPSLASSSAEERPMPRLEPVMTATLPVRSNGLPFTARTPFFVIRLLLSLRHGRACPGHPRLSCCYTVKTWMPGTRPGMTTIVIPGHASSRGPGISRFRVRCFASPGNDGAKSAPRNDGSRLNQPAAAGDAAEVIVGVAEAVLDHGQPLEVVADPGFLRHADAAVELDRLLADELSRLADLHFRRRHRGGALAGVVEVGGHGRE